MNACSLNINSFFGLLGCTQPPQIDLPKKAEKSLFMSFLLRIEQIDQEQWLSQSGDFWGRGGEEDTQKILPKKQHHPVQLFAPLGHCRHAIWTQRQMIHLWFTNFSFPYRHTLSLYFCTSTPVYVLLTTVLLFFNYCIDFVYMCMYRYFLKLFECCNSGISRFVINRVLSNLM